MPNAFFSAPVSSCLMPTSSATSRKKSVIHFAPPAASISSAAFSLACCSVLQRFSSQIRNGASMAMPAAMPSAVIPTPPATGISTDPRLENSPVFATPPAPAAPAAPVSPEFPPPPPPPPPPSPLSVFTKLITVLLTFSRPRLAPIAVIAVTTVFLWFLSHLNASTTPFSASLKAPTTSAGSIFSRSSNRLLMELLRLSSICCPSSVFRYSISLSSRSFSTVPIFVNAGASCPISSSFSTSKLCFSSLNLSFISARLVTVLSLTTFCDSSAARYSSTVWYDSNSGFSSFQLLPNSSVAFVSCSIGSSSAMMACPARKNRSIVSVVISCSVSPSLPPRSASPRSARCSLIASLPFPMALTNLSCAPRIASADVSRVVSESASTCWYSFTVIPYCCAPVAVSSAHPAASMVAEYSCFPRSIALSTAPCRPSVIFPIPSVTWSRLIFLLMLFRLCVSWSAPLDALPAPSPSRLRATSASLAPDCAFSICTYSFW